MISECIFCKIANKEVPANVVYEDEYVCCFLDMDPINEGHILIVPKKHFLDVDELDDKSALAIMKASVIITRALKNLYKPNGYSIMQNGGEFNDVGHYHMHVFPRYYGDGFGWTYRDGETGVNMRLSKTCTDIKCEISELLGNRKCNNEY